MNDLCRFVIKYCERLGYTPKVLAKYEGSITLEAPPEALDSVRWLGGSHVVQRVPPTESKGRRHTSIVSIAVTGLKNVNLDIPEKEIRLDTMRGTGPGGQAVNKTESTVRATHVPTGINVRINGPDQYGNKQKALQILKSRVADLIAGESQTRINRERNDQMGNSRGNKDFTWSYIDGFVKNHSNGKTVRNVKEIERGNMDLLR